MLMLEANIPDFLRSSPYLQSLLSNGPFPEEGLEIPDGSGKQDLTVKRKVDLIELLSTLRFWLVPEVAEQSSDLLRLALLPTSQPDFVEVATEFRNDIPLVDELFQIVNSSGEKRLETAAGFGRLQVVRFLCASGVNRKGRSVENALIACVRKGHLECLEHLHSLGYAKDDRLMKLSAKEGHLDCLKFLHEHNYPARGVCLGAASHGRLECLKYAHEQGMPWNEFICLAAAERGHLECLKYLREQGCPWWDEPVEEDLPLNDRNIHCANRVQVAVDITNYYDDGQRELIAASACRALTIDCLLYVLEQGAALSPLCAGKAANSGSLATLQFLHARGFTWEAEHCAAAVPFGSLDCVRFLHEIGTPWDARTLTAAVKTSDLPVLQYAHERGVPWEAEASLGCKLDIMKFVHEHGCPWHADTCLTAALQGDLECLQYAHEHGAPWTSEVCRHAATVECYEYAVAHGCPGARLNKRLYKKSKDLKL